jgi:ribosomal protein S18 acetylase RimI-like enzyme
MLRLTDPAAVRCLLETDRVWSVYALGDLATRRWPHGTWLAAPDGPPALVLLYREFGTPVLLAVGAAEAVRPLLDEIDEPHLYLHVRPEILDLLRPRYYLKDEADMWRMRLDPARFPTLATPEVVPLGPSDLPALRQLFADGEPAGEVPHFFFADMLEDRAFFGIWYDGALIAAGGTHLVEPAEGVAAIGNIYTRRDQRGRGLATRVTYAVTAELLRRGLPTLVLNVNQLNTAAVRVYERLGFERYCAFKEGEAIRMTNDASKAPNRQ